jgi:hypothetical protein
MQTIPRRSCIQRWALDGAGIAVVAYVIDVSNHFYAVEIAVAIADAVVVERIVRARIWRPIDRDQVWKKLYALSRKVKAE